MSYEYTCRHCKADVFSWDAHSCPEKIAAQARMPKTWQLMNDAATANVVASELSPRGNILVEVWFRPRSSDRWQAGLGGIIGPVDGDSFDMLAFFVAVMRDKTRWPWRF